MEISNQILSDITVYMKYSRYIPELERRETWDELVTRNMEMHIKKYPNLEEEIRIKYKKIYDKMILPSMRSLQFGGKPIDISPNRIYNCAYLPIDDWRAFGEVMFLLLGGTGVGYSVQKHHVDELPEINKPNPNRKRRYLIADSIEGWADSIKLLMKSYFQGGSTLDFDFRDIRPKGARLITSGGKAPGPQPLKECLIKIEGILSQKQNNEKLTTIEVHDIICHIADAVLAGGIRRAALISLFSADDEDMIACKSGPWWELNPQRGRANNSAALLRNKITKEFFLDLWKKIEASGSGEPGIYFTNDKAKHIFLTTHNIEDCIKIEKKIQLNYRKPQNINNMLNFGTLC
jgi:ribonucleoside-diphosphate reductase alpha chain